MDTEHTTTDATGDEQQQAPAEATPQEATPDIAPTPDVAPQEDAAEEEGKRIKQLNAEAARYRTERNQVREENEQLAAKVDKLMKGIASLAGQEPEETDPEKALAAAVAERDAARQELRTMRVSSDLSSHIAKAGADPSLTLAVLKADGTLDQLDPTADDYASQVEAAVSAVVEAHPRLVTQVVPQTSGHAPTPTDNSTGLGAQITRDDLDKMTPQEIYDAQKAGKLNHLL